MILCVLQQKVNALADRLLNDGIRGQGEKPLVAGECQARIAEALVALCLEEPGIVGCAVDAVN